MLSQWLEVERHLEQRPSGSYCKWVAAADVTRIGLEKDIKDASIFDRFPIIAELTREPLRIVRV